MTTNHVLVETTALVQHRLGLEAVRSFADDVLPVLQIHWVSETEHHAAQTALLIAARRKLSFIDCTSFEVMPGLGLTKVFTFDKAFSEQGFERVPHP